MINRNTRSPDLEGNISFQINSNTDLPNIVNKSSSKNRDEESKGRVNNGGILGKRVFESKFNVH
jgi:hypothetical protein